MNIIFLQEMRAETIIGIYEWEKTTPQTVEIDLEIAIPSEASCHSDKISDTIHYGLIVERLRSALAEHHFQLIEALAEYIAKVLREEFGSPWIRVSVSKLAILPGVKRVGVSIERGHKPT